MLPKKVCGFLIVTDKLLRYANQLLTRLLGEKQIMTILVDMKVKKDKKNYESIELEMIRRSER